MWWPAAASRVWSRIDASRKPLLPQIEANRRNAQRRSGPKTDEGKDRVRRNAVKHDMTGTEQEFSSSYEHLEGDTTGVVDPDVFFFEAHL